MDSFSLDEILNNDPLNVFKTLKVKNPIVTPDDRLITSFEEINKFYKDNKYEPKQSVDINEITLYSRLKGIRKNKSKIEVLKKYDIYNLLETKEIVKFDSIDDILNNDTLGIFDNHKEDIFTLKNVPKIDTERAEADFVSKREKCKNFEEYEELFIQCQKDLKDGKRKLVKFNEQYYKDGAFFVLKGVLAYLEKIENKTKDKYNKLDARTKIIFENGTKSNMYLRSLGKGLYEDGYFVSVHEDKVLDDLNQVNDDDMQNGYIYILESLSTDDRITTKKDLYKIGFSTTTVKTRISNAKNDPTYLMANVKIVEVFEVFNVNTHKLEQLIHRFFANTCLDINIIDSKGNIYKPKEWFVVPLEVIEEAIKLIISGKIINYCYDVNTESILKKN
jgi:hypothetical protein